MRKGVHGEWLPCSAFKLSPVFFSHTLFPRWFPRLKFESFQRQLHKHGFRRLHRKGKYICPLVCCFLATCYSAFITSPYSILCVHVGMNCQAQIKEVRGKLRLVESYTSQLVSKGFYSQWLRLLLACIVRSILS